MNWNQALFPSLHHRITARRGGCVIKKFREATEADAAGVVFLLFSSEHHPGLAKSGCFAIFVDRSATPPRGDARRGISLDCDSFTPSIDRLYRRESARLSEPSLD